ncbi:MAG: hypothetical protein JWR77_2203 [Rhizorhabdus sp.]|nr:hypothetical protein [Rhizorhabdus sp.]
MRKIDEIADVMRKAYAADMLAGMQGPTLFFADRIESCYVPPRESDGWFDGQRLRDYQEVEVKVLRQVLPDARLADVTVLTRADDQIIVVMTLTGTFTDGRPFAAPVTMVYDLAGGEIVRVTGLYDAAKLAPFAAAFAAAAQHHDVPIAMTRERAQASRTPA